MVKYQNQTKKIEIIVILTGGLICCMLKMPAYLIHNLVIGEFFQNENNFLI